MCLENAPLSLMISSLYIRRNFLLHIRSQSDSGPVICCDFLMKIFCMNKKGDRKTMKQNFRMKIPGNVSLPHGHQLSNMILVYTK